MSEYRATAPTYVKVETRSDGAVRLRIERVGDVPGTATIVDLPPRAATELGYELIDKAVLS